MNHTNVEPKHYIIIEHKEIEIGNGNGKILREHAENLQDVMEKTNKIFSTRALSFSKNRILANKYVGIVGNTDCSLEILPKIDSSIREVGDKKLLRERLVKMLAVYFKIKIDVGQATRLNWDDSILEFLIQAYVTKLSELVSLGLPRSYISIEDDLPILRGSLNVVQQFTRHAVNPTKLSCCFDELTDNNILNQKIKATLLVLYSFSRNQNNKRQLRKLLNLYSGIDDVFISKLIQTEIVWNRSNTIWKDLSEMSDKLLKNMFQNNVGGKNIGYSFLFSMQDLFEGYIGERLKEVGEKNGYRVETQVQKEYCLNADFPNDRTMFQIRPDILVQKDDEIVVIIDTKWKLLRELSTKGFVIQDKSVSNSDVFQMMVYGSLYNAFKVVLLYPHSSKLKGDEGIQLSGLMVGQDGRRLTVYTIDLSKPDIEDEDKRLLEMLKKITNANKSDKQ